MATPSSTIVQNFFTQIDTAFVTYFADASARVAGAARPVFNTLVTIYVLLWGFAIWRGLIREPMSDGAMRVLKIVLVGTFALNAGVYGTQIAGRIYRMPEQLAAVVAPVAAMPARNAIDRSIDAGIDVVAKFQAAAAAADGIVEPLTLHIDAIVAFLWTGVLALYAAALILLAKIGLSITLALGPLFIAMLLFKPTQQFFSAWLNQTINFFMTFVVASTIVALGMAFFNVAANSVVASIGSGVPAFTQLMKIILVGGAVFIALMQTNAIASALAGGVQIGTMGAVGWAIGKARGIATSPFSTARSIHNFNQRRLANDYYRRQMGMKPTLSTRLIRGIVRGNQNSIKKS